MFKKQKNINVCKCDNERNRELIKDLQRRVEYQDKEITALQVNLADVMNVLWNAQLIDYQETEPKPEPDFTYYGSPMVIKKKRKATK